MGTLKVDTIVTNGDNAVSISELECSEIKTVDRVHFNVLDAPPEDPVDGDVAFANGTSWNPGGTGRGLYQYVNNTWIKL